MREPARFMLSGYIVISPKSTGVMYPLFTAEGVNVSFVQEVGRNGEITDFIPFYEDDHFSFVLSSQVKYLRVGEPSIYAFFNNKNELVETDFDAIGQRAHVLNDLIDDKALPLLTRLTLSRIGRGGNQENLLAEFMSERIGRPLSVKIATAASKRSAAERDQWWSALLGSEETKSSQISSEFHAAELENVFEWLYENPVSDKWSRTLRSLLNKIIYDQRIFDLIIKLITSSEGTLEELSHREKSIIGRGLELYSALDSSEADFVDATYDYIVSGEIFKLVSVVPLEVIINFIEDIEASGILETMSIDIYLDELRSQHIDGAVARVLVERILSSQALRQPFGSKSYYEGQSRLDVLKSIIRNSGRLGLVLDSKLRNSIKRKSIF